MLRYFWDTLKPGDLKSQKRSFRKFEPTKSELELGDDYDRIKAEERKKEIGNGILRHIDIK